MRFANLCFLFLPIVLPASSGCSLLADDHCTGDTRTASGTPPLTGAALSQWNDSSCTSSEDDICARALPLETQLELCLHEPNAIPTDGGAFMALRCHYTSTADSCRPSSSHDPD
jgi:hypothetical protein